MLSAADGAKPADGSLWLSEQQAVALAQRAIVSEHGGLFPRDSEATLRLVLRSEVEINPEWQIQFSDGTRYGAFVDALTGATRTYSTIIH